MVAVKATEDFRQGNRIPQTRLQLQTKKASSHNTDGDILIYLMTWSSSPSFVLSAILFICHLQISGRSSLYEFINSCIQITL